MRADDQEGRVIPFPSRRESLNDVVRVEAFVATHPACLRAQASLAEDRYESSVVEPVTAFSDPNPPADVWHDVDAAVRAVAPEDFGAYESAGEFRRLFGFDLPRNERAQMLLFKHRTGITDLELRLLGRTRSLRFTPAVSISASKAHATLGYGLFTAVGLLMLMGLLAAMTPAGQTLRGALIVIPYEAVLVGFLWAVMQMYLRPYTIRRRVELFLGQRETRQAAI